MRSRPAEHSYITDTHINSKLFFSKASKAVALLSQTGHTDVLTFGPNQMLFGKLRPGPLNFSRLNLSPVLRSRTFEVNGHRMPSESM